MTTSTSYLNIWWFPWDEKVQQETPISPYDGDESQKEGERNAALVPVPIPCQGFLTHKYNKTTPAACYLGKKA